MRWLKPHAIVGLVIFAWAVGCAPKPEETTFRGISLRPPGASEVDGALPQNAIYMFENRDFKGKVSRIENITSQPPGLTDRVGARSDDMTSLEWDLPAGIVVVFYENADGTGNQFPIWGRGQLDSVSKWAFNDKVSRWAWYSVGGAANSSASLERGMMPPHMARPTTNLPSDTLELYSDRDLKGQLKTISPVTSESQLEYHGAGMINDQMTSARWNLPEGILVVFYDNIDGTGRQLAVWNKGEHPTVTPWNMNDKVSSWAWYRLGEPGSR
ncbi:MAG TPA: hypothetical protein VGQ99_15010 [Tepidisphaeraceae bacterium]|nr:hypothetical protein [Tepidisphaeraceae bacterium]